MRRKRLDGSVGFVIGQAFGAVSCDAQFIERIVKRRRVRLAGQRPLEQGIEGGRYGGLVHEIALLVTARINARWPFATRFPGDSPTAQWPQAVLSDSTARSIAPTR